MAPAIESSVYEFADFDNIVPVLSLSLAGAIGVVFAWWAVRRVTAIIMNAFRRGRLKM